MIGTALHVKASLWRHCHVRASHDTDIAALVMEGEVPDRGNGGGPVADALYWAVLARGLGLAMDLDELDLRPVRGWHVHVGSGALTLGWPHLHPLLETAPVELPPGWLEAATDLGFVLVTAGYGLGLSANGHLGDRLARAARAGALAAGAVLVVDPVETLPSPRTGT
jgi:hypothetical protein